MRITREYFFDMVDLVGRAIATGRQRPADDSWLDGMLPKWMRGRPRANPAAHAPGQDEFGLLDGTPWSSEECASERTDLAGVAPGAEDFGFGPLERRKASRNKDEYGDSVSCELWQLDRRLRFREVGVTDALKELQSLCARIARRLISEGWATRLSAIIDDCAGNR